MRIDAIAKQSGHILDKRVYIPEKCRFKDMINKSIREGLECGAGKEEERVGKIAYLISNQASLWFALAFASMAIASEYEAKLP